MKNIIYLFFLVLITTTENVKSQEINPLDFFPYHVGDIWQYIEIPSGPLRTVRITDVDTTNYLTHYIYYDNNIIPYEKILTDSAIVLADSNHWFPLYKLSYPLSSIWVRDTTTSWWVHFKSQFISEVFNQNRETREYHIYEFIPPGDTNGLPGTVEYLVQGIGLYRITWEGGEIILNGCIINGVQYGTIVSVENENENLHPSEYILNNFPNPFNSQTTIHFYLPSSTFITLSIYDILGNEIERLYSGEEREGQYYKVWNPKDVTSGLYFVVMRTNETQITHKILLLK
ncbi:MAG TPA: T9SS type A sorting domain-containing protein [Ignavibacteriaceae bacterium]|nr:T9SS type A sorting domain-containing protein [Ignavibacteriaceae bacterium]